MSFKSSVLSLYLWWILLLRFVKLVNILEFIYPNLNQIHILRGMYSEMVFFPYHTIVTIQYQVLTLSLTSDPCFLCKWLSFLWIFQLWNKLYQALFFQILMRWIYFKSAVLLVYIWRILILRFLKLASIVKFFTPNKQSEENTHYMLFVQWKGVFTFHTIVISQYQVLTLSPTSDPCILYKWLSFLWRYHL